VLLGAAEGIKTFGKNTHLQYMQGLIRVLQSVTISLSAGFASFPLQGSPAFFLPLFTGVHGRIILRSSPGKLQEIPHWKVVPLLAMLLH
jgi:hypothetical protein